ncbi:putative protein 23 [Rhizopogon vesiculosus]|uniref:Uncharacterized protein n=1 Tax=Rhizopogon vesiculosus TaxID=180088 RepID=A0A1J8R0G5_9AGAM|nr:putative protein 23 [Rhizopogon vesiculosus]
MSPHRSTRASKTTSRKTNESSLRHGAHASKNPIPAPCPEKLDMDEATLRKLSRAALQKVAKENNVKANMKSNLIIEELVKLCKVVPLYQDEESEEPARKKSRTSLHDQTHSESPRRVGKESPPVAVPPTQIMDVPMDTDIDHVTVPEGLSKPVLTAQRLAPTIAASNDADIAAAGTSQGPSSILESHTEHVDTAAVGTSEGPSPMLESLTGHKALEDDVSDSGSDLSYASKNGYYDSPVSSRAGTPPLEEPRMLERAVTIMNQITVDDQRILAQIAALRGRAATLKEQAQKARDVTRAEKGRRMRLEAYFTYWREIEPEWPKEWIYEEGEEDRIRTEQALRAITPLLPSTGPSGPPTLPPEERDLDSLAARISLRRRQIKLRQENGAAAPPPGVEQPRECANRLPSPQSSTGERGAKRKSRS